MNISDEHKAQVVSAVSPNDWVRGVDNSLKPFRLVELEEQLKKYAFVQSFSRVKYGMPLSRRAMNESLSKPAVSLPIFKSGHIQKLLRQSGDYATAKGTKFTLRPCVNAMGGSCTASIMDITGCLFDV